MRRIGFGRGSGDLRYSLLVSAGFCAVTVSCCCLGLATDTAPPGGAIWNVLACCLENRTRTVRTSSWMEASVVTSDVRASWFSDMSRRMWSMSCFSRSSFLTSFWTCCSRTSRMRSMRWIESSWGRASSWICGGPWFGAGRGRRDVEFRLIPRSLVRPRLSCGSTITKRHLRSDHK